MIQRWVHSRAPSGRRPLLVINRSLLVRPDSIHMRKNKQHCLLLALFRENEARFLSTSFFFRACRIRAPWSSYYAVISEFFAEDIRIGRQSWTEGDRNMSQLFIETFSNFAKYGWVKTNGHVVVFYVSGVTQLNSQWNSGCIRKNKDMITPVVVLPSNGPDAHVDYSSSQ